jgi:drug/metabolite transporter (DMT)-like permease
MSKTHVSIVLSASILAISTAAILVRLVPELHPLSIAFSRTALVGIALGWSIFDPRFVRPRGRLLLWTCLAALFLALHFWAWFSSLQLTTVLRSTVLVCLTPIWAGLFAWRSEPPKPRFWGGIIIALLGLGVMVGADDMGSGSSNSHGDALGVLGGILSGSYLSIGRQVRPHVDWAPYAAILCVCCAFWLAIFSAFAHVDIFGALAPSALSTSTMWVLLAMAIGPQLLGHTGFTIALRYVPAYVIGAVILLEPVGATPWAPSFSTSGQPLKSASVRW